MEGFSSDIATHDLQSFPAAVLPKKSALQKKKEERPKKKRTELTADQVKQANGMMKEKEQKKKTNHVDAKAGKLRKISQYQEKLGHLMTYKVPKVSIKTNDDVLTEILFNIECDLGMKSAVEYGASMYMGGIQGLEQLTNMYNPLGLKISKQYGVSLTEVIAMNQEKWQDIVTELAIKHSEWLMMGPLKRLMYFTVTSILSVHQANALGASLNEPADAQTTTAGDKL